MEQQQQKCWSKKETEQEMNKLIAGFAYEFRQQFGDGFKITIKPVGHRHWRKKRIV